MPSTTGTCEDCRACQQLLQHIISLQDWLIMYNRLEFTAYGQHPSLHFSIMFQSECRHTTYSQCCPAQQTTYAATSSLLFQFPTSLKEFWWSNHDSKLCLKSLSHIPSMTRMEYTQMNKER